jgi:D-arabinose 1-dehydrogenase-like Zn-dependent alcohol dehydrogenase
VFHSLYKELIIFDTMSDFNVPRSCACVAAKTPAGPFESFSITRRACGPNDVVIEIKYAGICHSDIHQVNQDWGPAIFPMVPGHEIGRLPKLPLML